ncbi:MAG: hypothetical protein Q8L34_05185 [Candidatus Woesearchaeota archaeon]|nr:hypothetical protein [Candidatus Woesearchaeota archaeon]
MPQNEIVIHVPPAHSDQRGQIINFLRYVPEAQGFKIPDLPKDIPDDTFVEVASFNFLNKGDIRANHYHPDGLNQFVYCLAGSYESYSQKIKLNKKGEPEAAGEVQKIIVKAGDIVFTPSMIAHAMKALAPNTVALNLNPRLRDHDHYYKSDKPHTLPFKLIQ